MVDNKFLPKLSQNLLEILYDNEYYDIIIEVGSDPYVKIFRAHMVILNYRSPYLRRILLTNEKKNDETLVHIKLSNILPETFQIILRYIYGGIISLDEYDTSDIIKVLVAANELNLQELIPYLQSFLIQNKSSWMEQNFNLIYQTSFENYSLMELQKFCMELISNEPEKIFKSLDFISISEKFLISLIQNDNLQMTVVQVWNYVLKWGFAKNPKLSSDNLTNFSNDDFNSLGIALQQCLPFIKFHNLTYKEFSDKVVPYKKIFPKRLYEDLLKDFLDNDNKTNNTRTTSISAISSVNDLTSVPCLPQNPELNSMKFKYDRDFLMQFKTICVERPENLIELEAIGMEEPKDDKKSRTGSRASAGSKQSEFKFPPKTSEERFAAAMNMRNGASSTVSPPPGTSSTANTAGSKRNRKSRKSGHQIQGPNVTQEHSGSNMPKYSDNNDGWNLVGSAQRNKDKVGDLSKFGSLNRSKISGNVSLASGGILGSLSGGAKGWIKSNSENEDSGISQTNMSEEEATKKINNMVEEYFSVLDHREVILYIKDIPAEYHAKAIETFANKVIEKKQKDVDNVMKLFKEISSGTCDIDTFKNGLKATLEFLMDIGADAPLAYSYTGQLLFSAGLDLWDTTKLLKPWDDYWASEKIVKGYTGALKNNLSDQQYTQKINEFDFKLLFPKKNKDDINKYIEELGGSPKKKNK